MHPTVKASCCDGYTRSPDRRAVTLAERACGGLIGSIRWECLDHIVVFGEAHLRRIFAAYAGYYNGFRTHLSLDRIRRAIVPFGGSARSLDGRSPVAFTMNTAGCSYRYGQGVMSITEGRPPAVRRGNHDDATPP
jgi:hypothetical protein